VLHDVIARVDAQGVVLVAAAGNAATDAVQYPAAYDQVLSVTAVDAQGHKADFANYGAWVGIAAPGVGVTSTMVGPDGSGYASWSGTSMATSFVSGAAALAREQAPNDPASAIVQTLIAAAADLDALNPPFADKLGGLLDVGAALDQDAHTAQQIYLPLIAY
jgi:subtilisin family serine protease